MRRYSFLLLASTAFFLVFNVSTVFSDDSSTEAVSTTSESLSNETMTCLTISRRLPHCLTESVAAKLCTIRQLLSISNCTSLEAHICNCTISASSTTDELTATGSNSSDYDYTVLNDVDVEICDMDNVLGTWNATLETTTTIPADFGNYTIIYTPEWGNVTTPNIVDVEQTITHPTSTSTDSTDSKTTTAAAPNIVDVSDIITHSEDTTTDPRTTVTTTEDPACAIQCPEGYIAGTSLCFLFLNLSDIKSYQYALSSCQALDLQNLISLEHLRNLNDLNILKSQSKLIGSTNLYFANGGGSRLERFSKEAQVFDITQLTAMTSPIETTVGISDTTSNISAICVLPQYCNSTQCFIDTQLTVLELSSILSTSEETVASKATASITCSYTKAVTTVTCGARGNLMPNPTQISCEAEGAAQKVTNTTGQLVADCSECFARGTESCDAVEKDGSVAGFTCTCKSGYTMSGCWYTGDSCTSSSCNGHGKCTDTLGSMKCNCDWGYEGTNCETSKDRVTNTTDSFGTRLGNSINLITISALQTTSWSILTIVAKSCGKIYLSNGDDDPQETHQALRGYLMTLGSTCVLFFNDPYLFKISQATCRFFFLIIHFCFLGAMIQWMSEGYNANQVVRCIHLNEWERDFKGQRTWGIMVIPRVIPPLALLAVALALIFQTNWYQVPSTWTCVGVICNSTTSIWLAVLWIVICVVLTTAAFAESSVLLKHRRPLYDLKIRKRIERDEGIIDGWVAEKCRRNTLLCCIGSFFLSCYWLCTILAADKRSNKALGWVAIGTSTIYGMFTFCQGLYTDPNTWTSVMWRAMKHLPARFAPSYDPISMWTREEVKELLKHPKPTQALMRAQMIPRNKRLFLQHKWDLQLNEKLTDGVEINAALLEILRAEIKRHSDSLGTQYQKQQLQETFAEFVKTVSDRPPRDDLLDVSAKSEAVTLCAEKEDGSAKVTKFMLIPGIDVFEPEESLDDDMAEKRLQNEIDKETYKIAREEAVAQNNFMNSAIKFKHYGKIKG